MLSEDRKLEGLVLIRSIAENIGLPNLKRYRGLFLNKKLEKQDAEQMKEKLSIKTPSVQKNGNIACTVFQNALGQAKWGAISAYDACVNGKQETASFAIPFETVDASNVDDYLE